MSICALTLNVWKLKREYNRDQHYHPHYHQYQQWPHKQDPYLQHERENQQPQQVQEYYPLSNCLGMISCRSWDRFLFSKNPENVQLIGPDFSFITIAVEGFRAIFFLFFGAEGPGAGGLFAAAVAAMGRLVRQNISKIGSIRY